MPFSTYTELKDEIADWLDRTDLTAKIPSFILLAEKTLNRRLRTRDQLETSSSTINGQYLALPDDWLQTENVVLESDPIGLEYATPAQANALIDQLPPSGRPKYYTITGRNLRIIPAPDTSYAVKMDYYKAIPALSAGSPTNWLLTSNPDVYLAAALLAANTYLRDAEGMVSAKAALDLALEEISTADSRSKTPTTPVVRSRSIG